MSRAGPPVVVRPTTIAEVAAAVRDAELAGRTVAARGAGRRFDPAAWPKPPDVLVETSALDAFVAPAPGATEIAAGPGARLDLLELELAAVGLTTGVGGTDDPLDTLGGIVGAGAAGPTGRFGRLSDRIAGVTLVVGGGRVVESAAGHDLAALAVGSAGALGIVACIRWKLSPRPPSRPAMVRLPPTRHEAWEWAAAARAKRRPFGPILYDDGELTAVLDLPDADLPEEFRTPKAGPRPPANPAPLVFRADLPAGAAADLLDRLAAAAPGAAETTLLPSGPMRLRFARPPAAPEAERIAAELAALLAAGGGSFHVERQPPEWRRILDHRPPAEAAALRAAKAALDPAGTFPGLAVR